MSSKWFVEGLNPDFLKKLTEATSNPQNDEKFKSVGEQMAEIIKERIAQPGCFADDRRMNEELEEKEANEFWLYTEEKIRRDIAKAQNQFLKAISKLSIEPELSGDEMKEQLWGAFEQYFPEKGELLGVEYAKYGEVKEIRGPVKAKPKPALKTHTFKLRFEDGDILECPEPKGNWRKKGDKKVYKWPGAFVASAIPVRYNGESRLDDYYASLDESITLVITDNSARCWLGDYAGRINHREPQLLESQLWELQEEEQQEPERYQTVYEWL